MAMFDLEKTAILETLFLTPREARDAAWLTAFYEAAPDASMATRDQQIAKGPDGFPYFALYTPPKQQEFEAYCVNHILQPCLDNGTGIVFHPDKSPPEWVFSYGNLWSLQAHGKFDQLHPHGERRAPLTSGREVLIAAPNETMLPPFARKVLRDFIQSVGIAQPRVLLISDPSARLTHSLCFSFYPDEFPTPEAYRDVMDRLKGWFLPSHYGLVGLPRDDANEKHFGPL